MPKIKERVKFIVVSGEKKLKDSVVSIKEFEKYQISYKYYIEKQINIPLGRLFKTIGIDLKLWFENRNK
jgi:DNA polymerase elongation subunit (family B)